MVVYIIHDWLYSFVKSRCSNQMFYYLDIQNCSIYLVKKTNLIAKMDIFKRPVYIKKKKKKKKQKSVFFFFFDIYVICTLLNLDDDDSSNKIFVYKTFFIRYISFYLSLYLYKIVIIIIVVVVVVMLAKAVSFIQ